MRFIFFSVKHCRSLVIPPLHVRKLRSINPLNLNFASIYLHVGTIYVSEMRLLNVWPYFLISSVNNLARHLPIKKLHP